MALRFSSLSLFTLACLTACEIPRSRGSGSVTLIVFGETTSRNRSPQHGLAEQLVPTVDEVSEPNNRVVTKVSAFETQVFAPRITADGKNILFSSNADQRKSSWNIRRISLSGGGVQELTRGEWTDLWPIASPDNSKVIFVSNRLTSSMSLCSVRSDGLGGIGMIHAGEGAISDPDIAHDGRIVFELRRSGLRPQIWTTELNGGLLTQLCEGEQPRWMPQSSNRLCFVRRDHQGLGKIWTINIDGSDERKLTEGDGNDLQPCWSPDGKMIAFSSNRGQSSEWAYDVFVMNADGSGLTQITSNNSWDGSPMFAPDGNHLYFLSSRGGAIGLWRVNWQ